MNFSESFKDINEWLEQVMEFIRIIPVSYTHLDVYKRQEYYLYTQKTGTSKVRSMETSHHYHELHIPHPAWQE